MSTDEQEDLPFTDAPEPEFVEGKTRAWGTMIAVTAVILGCSGGVMGLHFFNMAKEDRQWLASSSRRGEDWRVAVPPIERNYFNWDLVDPMVVVRGGASKEARLVLHHDLEKQAIEVLSSVGVSPGLGAGGILIIDLSLEGGPMEEETIRFSLTNFNRTAVIWNERIAWENGRGGWREKLARAFKLGIAGGMPDGTWNLRVTKEVLEARRKKAESEQAMWRYAKKELGRGN